MKISTILLIILLVGCQEARPGADEIKQAQSQQDRLERDIFQCKSNYAGCLERGQKSSYCRSIYLTCRYVGVVSHYEFSELDVIDEKMKLNCECKKEIKKTEKNTYDDRLRYLDLGSGNVR